MNLLSITRTCGGDPGKAYRVIFDDFVLPAHAGVILPLKLFIFSPECITRTCGGDPIKDEIENSYKKYYPHMRG